VTLLVVETLPDLAASHRFIEVPRRVVGGQDADVELVVAQVSQVLSSSPQQRPTDAVTKVPGVDVERTDLTRRTVCGAPLCFAPPQTRPTRPSSSSATRTTSRSRLPSEIASSTLDHPVADTSGVHSSTRFWNAASGIWPRCAARKDSTITRPIAGASSIAAMRTLT
jgi:hypothetical protein